MNSALHGSIYCRVRPWPSSWVQRLTWSAQRSPRRRASTACSARPRWPASTSCSLSPRPAPPAASPKDSSTCPASQICSPPPSRRRRPRAARSCEWRPLGLQSSHATPSPCLFGLGEGGVGTMVLSGLPAESFPHPPGNQTPLRRGGHLAVHLLLNLLAHIHLFPLLFILLSNKQYQSRFDHRALVFFTCKQYATTMVLHLSDFTISRHMLILSKLEMCNVWRLILWCKCLSDNSMDIFLSTKIYLAWNRQELAKILYIPLSKACEVCNSLSLVSPFKARESAEM